MTLPPKKLFIPRKGVKTPSLPVSTQDHDTNMRAIEQYVNNLAPGGVTQLIAGTDITLDPADGTGVVTVNSTGGGGGGAQFGYGYMIAMMDSATYPFAGFLGPTNLAEVGVVQLGPLYGSDLYPIGTDAAAEKYTFASSWITQPLGGGGPSSVNILPFFYMPTFDNAGHDPITLEFFMFSTTVDGAYDGYALYQGSVSIPWPGGSTVQTTAADLTGLFGGAQGDLSLVDGTGTTGNGFISASGSFLYLSSVSGGISMDADTTFPGP